MLQYLRTKEMMTEDVNEVITKLKGDMTQVARVKALVYYYISL